MSRLRGVTEFITDVKVCWASPVSVTSREKTPTSSPRRIPSRRNPAR